MADMEEDKDVSRRYRELGREEPPPALDARLRAEARSALETRAAPLVAPTGRRRWYFPVAAAAVIVLAVAVTTQVEREQPSEPVAATQEGKKEAAPEAKQKIEEAKPLRQAPKVEESPAKRAEPRPFAQQPKDQVAASPPAAGERGSGAERSRDEFSRNNRDRQERPAAAPPAPAAPAETRSAEARSKMRADTASGAVAGAAVTFQTPEAWLAHIQALRQAGSDDEADRQLDAFRKRYPDYKIPPDTLEKVQRKKAR
ncbi:MAG TPA: hypothetical protein VNH12_13450 [Burkholderiales bacterium]|nr:hypothetical protein [Burkholderiales bacterium]